MKWSLLILTLAFSRAYGQDTTEETGETTEPTTVIPVLYLSDSAPKLSWSPKSDESVIIEADEGYKISVNITDCNIDGQNGEYATITTEQGTDGLMFSYAVRSQPAYLYNSSRLFGDFFGTNASNFTAVFTRIGEQLTTTTTDIPTTTIILPQPTVNDSDTLTVYFAGRASSDYDKEVVDSLINAITRMAVEYCDMQNFPVNGSITSKNVQIRRIAPCSINWPDSETCATVTFAVPVLLRNDSDDSLWGGYQMTTEHLEIMWHTYIRYLPDDMTIYTKPDMGILKWGIVLGTGIVVLLIVCLFIIRHYIIKVSKMMRRRRLSDTASIVSTSDRNSQMSLPPHYLQEIPALFENAYPMYNPEKSPAYAEPTYSKTFAYSDYQDIDTKMDEQLNDSEPEESGA